MKKKNPQKKKILEKEKKRFEKLFFTIEKRGIAQKKKLVLKNYNSMSGNRMSNILSAHRTYVLVP